MLSAGIKTFLSPLSSYVSLTAHKYQHVHVGQAWGWSWRVKWTHLTPSQWSWVRDLADPKPRGILPLAASQSKSSWLKETDLFHLKSHCWHSFFNLGGNFPRKIHWWERFPKNKLEKLWKLKVRQEKKEKIKEDIPIFIQNMFKGGFMG